MEENFGRVLMIRRWLLVPVAGIMITARAGAQIQSTDGFDFAAKLTPPPLSANGKARLYFNGTKFRQSLNHGAWTDFASNSGGVSAFGDLDFTGSDLSDIETRNFSDLQGIPTTIAGYGITDFNSLGDARWATLSHAHSFASLTDKPTTLSGYGITDAQPLDGDLTAVAALTTDSFGLQLLTKTTDAAIRSYIGAGTSSFGGAFSDLSGKPTTVSGYGIADAATLTGSETLTNKTLTAPKFADLGYIADANANKILVLDTVTSAVNQATLANAATSNRPSIKATGTDTNIGLLLQAKGTGAATILSGDTKVGLSAYNGDLGGIAGNADDTAAMGIDLTPDAFFITDEINAPDAPVFNVTKNSVDFGALSSVTFGTGAATAFKTGLSLNNVNNTADSAKRVLSATQVWDDANAWALIGTDDATLTFAHVSTATFDSGSKDAFKFGLGLVIGTNIQAFDTDLSSWAAVTRASGFDTFTATPTLANLFGLVTDEGTGVTTALGVNVGSAGAFVTNGGALGTPSSGTVTNLTGTASININGTVGATTPAAGTFTTATTPIIKPASDSTTALKITKADGTTAVATWDTTNSWLGIGVTPVTNSAAKLLHIGGGATSEIHLTNTNVGDTASDGLVIQCWSDSIAYIWNRENAAMSFGVNNAERMRLYPSGGLFLGTSPSDPGAGNMVVSGASAASTPALYFTGSWLTGGTGTTNFPHLFLQATGTTASTTWSTAGTAIGANAVTGFTGNLADLQLAGVSKFKISSAGAVTMTGGIVSSNGNNTFSGSVAGGSITSSDFVQVATGSLLRWGSNNSSPGFGKDAVNGITLQSAAGTATWNDASTANSGTVANRYLFGIATPTLSSTGTSVTYTKAATVSIGGAPVAGTNVTIGTGYALDVVGGTTNLGGSVKVGGGTAVTKILSATATLDFPSTIAQTQSDLTVTVTGAAVGDVVALGVPNGSVTAKNESYFGWVSAADTVTVRFNNAGLTSDDPASGTFRVMVTQF